VVDNYTFRKGHLDTKAVDTILKECIGKPAGAKK
jgi:hypothetical protein